MGTPITTTVKATEYKKTDWKRFRATLNFGTSKSPRSVSMEACVAKQLTPWTWDLKVWGSSLACCIVSLDKELYSTSSLFTQGLVVRRPISANPELTFNLGFFFFVQRHFAG